MNILFLSHRIPFPPDKGEKIRSFHWLAHLARQGNVDLVTHVDDVKELRHQQILADMCRDVRIFPLNPLVCRARGALSFLTGDAISVAWLTRPAGRALVQEWLATRDYDLVFAYSSQMGAYLPRPLPVPLLMDMVDVDSEKFRSYAENGGLLKKLIFGREARCLNRLEKRLGEDAEKVLLATPNETAVYEERVGTGEVLALTNGVPRPEDVPDAATRDDDLIVFAGTMDYPANVAAAVHGARDVLPLVQRHRPNARFCIVGRNPTREVRELAELPGVEVTGGVASVRPYLESASVALVGLELARGIQNKVLEALAHGLPVVTTPSVLACMEPGGEEALLRGDDPQALAEHVVRLLADPVERARRGEAARAYVARNYDWDRLDARFDEIVAEIIGRPSPVGHAP